MELVEYISPSLLVLLPILYAIGGALKKSRFANWLIPFILGIAGITLACLWLLTVDFPSSAVELVKTMLMGVTQGVLCAAVTVYAHNLVKQYKKRDR